LSTPWKIADVLMAGLIDQKTLDESTIRKAIADINHE
jgi:hypothetical protein